MVLTDAQIDGFMAEAIAEARRGESEGEVPIGCVLVLGSGGEARVAARGHNRVNGLQRKGAHAEIVAFEDSSGKIPLDAEDVALFSTLEPCVMCFGAAIESGIPLVVFGCPAPLDQGTTRVREPESPEARMPEVRKEVRREECVALFTDWLAKNKEEKPEGDLQVAFVEATLKAVEDLGKA